MCEYVHVSAGTHRDQKGIRSSGTKVIGSCELPRMGAGNRTLGPVQKQQARNH